MKNVGTRPSRASFQLVDGPLADTLIDVIGVWDVASPQPQRDVAGYAAPSGAIADAPVWRVRLPSNYAGAERELSIAEEKLNAVMRKLNSLPGRLTAVIEEHQSFPVTQTSISGTAEAAGEFPEVLGAIRKMNPMMPSFGIVEGLPGQWGQASREIVGGVGRVIQFLSCFALVETRLEERLLGRTAVSWKGDMNTVWIGGFTSEEALLHQRSVALSLGSRDALLRTVVMAAQLGIKLSAVLSTPGGVILALPAVWRFIHQVLAPSGEAAREGGPHG